MDTSLQNTHIIDNQLAHPASPELEEEQLESEEESHIHLPGPSYWPIFLSVAILITIAGIFAVTKIGINMDRSPRKASRIRRAKGEYQPPEPPEGRYWG